MPFPANQVISYFHAFLSLLKAICLATIHIIASYVLRLNLRLNICVIALACQLPSSSHVSCVPQQLSSRKNGKFSGHRVESLLGLLVLFSVHSTIIITKALILIRQVVITLLPIFTLFDIEASYISLHSDNIVITLDFGYALVSCNNNKFILVMGYN